MAEDHLPHPIKTLVYRYPAYCVDPGANLVRNSAIAPLVAKVFHPPRPRKIFEVLKALKWYWAQRPSQFNRGSVWMEFTLDFIAAANVRYLAVERKKGASLALAKNAFSSLSLPPFQGGRRYFRL